MCYSVQLKRVVLLREQRLETKAMQKEKKAAELLVKATAARDGRIVKLNAWLAQQHNFSFADCDKLILWIESSTSNLVSRSTCECERMILQDLNTG